MASESGSSKKKNTDVDTDIGRNLHITGSIPSIAPAAATNRMDVAAATGPLQCWIAAKLELIPSTAPAAATTRAAADTGAPCVLQCPSAKPPGSVI